MDLNQKFFHECGKVEGGGKESWLVRVKHLPSTVRH